MPLGCLPGWGPYRLDRPAFTLAARDVAGVYHVLDSATGRAVCRSHAPRCPRSPLFGDPDQAYTVPVRRRCGDYNTWPGHADPPPATPRPWAPSRPPRWHVWRVLYELQEGRCAACCINPPHVVDHDHATGLIRGLLCRWCNAQDDNLRRFPEQCQCPHAPRCYTAYFANPPAAGLGWLYRH